MQDAKEEVRSRIAIEDVIGEYVQLKRAGRNFKGLSPFTQERTPSFVVSPDKQIWHDFSSGRGGDVFSFLMEVEGLEFREALEQLARKAGVELASFDSKQSGELAKRKKRLYEANELAAKYFQQTLVSNEHVQQYVFNERKLTKETVNSFRIGYAPDGGDALVSVLKKRGFSPRELADAGLTNRFGGDLFRARMMVALMDSTGRVIGFTGRILKDEPNAPKYLNTPQTLIYDKSRHVFGLHLAKEAIRTQDRSVIVEGNMEVVSSHQVNVSHVVATAGTALTEWQLKALSRLSGVVVLAFDADKAGLAATERAIPIAQSVGVELQIVTLPDDAKDPDELIQKDSSAWSTAIERAKPVLDWVIETYAAQEDMKTAAGKRSVTTRSIQVLRTLADTVELEHYLKKIAITTDTSFSAVKQKFDQPHSDQTKPLKKPNPVASIDATVATSHQDTLLGLSLIQPDVRQLFMSEEVNIIEGEASKRLFTYLMSHSDIFEDIPQELREIDTYVKIIQLKAETRYGTWKDDDIQLEAARLLRQIKLQHKKQQKDRLLAELRTVEQEEDDDAARILREKLQQLIKEIAHG